MCLSDRGLGSKQCKLVAASPDAIFLIDALKIPCLQSSVSPFTALVVVKTTVSSTSLQRAFPNSTMDVHTDELGSANFNALILIGNQLQILHQVVCY